MENQKLKLKLLSMQSTGDIMSKKISNGTIGLSAITAITFVKIKSNIARDKQSHKFILGAVSFAQPYSRSMSNAMDMSGNVRMQSIMHSGSTHNGMTLMHKEMLNDRMHESAMTDMGMMQ